MKRNYACFLAVICSYTMRRQYNKEGYVMVMETPAPWRDHLDTLEQEEQALSATKNQIKHTPVLYVVTFDGARNQYAATCVPKRKGSSVVYYCLMQKALFKIGYHSLNLGEAFEMRL